MNEVKLQSRVDDDGIKVTVVTKDSRIILDHLYAELTDRLLRGTKPDPWKAIETLQKRYPKRLQSVINKLVDNYSEAGLREFEASMVNGFKKCGNWTGQKQDRG
jgi:hypothetical protein